jgi:Flp pilus assembly protein TadD
MKNLLANAGKIYYSLTYVWRKHSSLLPATILISYSLILFPSQSYSSPGAELAEHYRLEGARKLQDGHLPEALSLFYRAAATSPSGPILNDLGVVYDKIGREQDAEASYLASISLDSSFLPSYMNLAILYRRNGNSSMAISTLRNCTENGLPQDPLILQCWQEMDSLALEVPYLREQKLKEQARAFEEDIAYQTRVYVERQLAQAKELYREGMLLSHSGRYAEAIAVFDAALQMAPGDVEIAQAREEAIQQDMHRMQLIRQHYAQAMQNLQSGQQQDARQEFHQIMSLIP